MVKLLKKITFTDLPLEVPLTKKRRKLYYTPASKKIPRNISMYIGLIYEWGDYGIGKRKKKVLLNSSTGLPVLRNADTVDKPRTITINGSHLHTTRLTDYNRSKIINYLNDYYQPFLLKENSCRLTPNNPLFIKLTFKVPRNSITDLDNFAAFYRKVLFDNFMEIRTAAKGKRYMNPAGFILDDNVDYLSDYSISYRTTHNKPKLIVEIFEHIYPINFLILT